MFERTKVREHHIRRVFSFPHQLRHRGKNLRIYYVSEVLPIARDWVLTGNTKVNRLIKQYFRVAVFVSDMHCVSCDRKLEYIFFRFEKEGPVQTPNFSWEHEKFGVLPAYLSRDLRLWNGFNADIICLQILFVCYSFYFWLIWSFTDQPCIIVCYYFNVFYNQFALYLQTFRCDLVQTSNQIMFGELNSTSETNATGFW